MSPQRSRLGRRGWGALALVVALIGLGLAWFARGPASTSSTSRDLPQTLDRPAPVATALEGRPRVPGVPTVATLDGLKLHVWVKRKADAAPVAGAAVRLVIPSTSREWLRVPTLAEVTSSAVTDEAGRARLPRPEPSAIELHVGATGFRPLTIPIDLRSLEITAELEPGDTIDGKVVDLAGRPVSGVHLTARPANEISDVTLEKLATEAISRSEVATDADGRFALGGLESGEVYALRLQSPEWRVARAEPVWGLGGTTAPATNLLIILQPVSYARIKLVDAATGLPITSLRPTVGGSGSHAKDRSFVIVGDPQAPYFVPSRLLALVDMDPGVHIVQVDGIAVSSGFIEFWLMVPEYKQAGSRAKLQTVSDLLSGSETETIALESVSSGPRGALEADCRRDRTRGLPRSAPILSLSRPGPMAPDTPGVTVRLQSGPSSIPYRGRWIREDVWLFENLPVGEWRAHLFDGISSSLAQAVGIEVDRTARVQAEWTDPTGIAITVVDEEGRRLLGALIAYKAEPIALPPMEGSRGTMTLHPAGSRIDHPIVGGAAGQAPGPAWLQLLTPAKYEISAHLRGYESGSVVVEVAHRELQEVTIVLRRVRRK